MIDINYRLIRSSRKTICISVRDNSVIVRAPFRTSIEVIERFIEKKRSWIIKQLSSDNLYNQLSKYGCVLVKGEKVPLIFGNKNLIEENCVTVKDISHLSKLYYKTFGEEFLKLYEEVSEHSGLKDKSVSFRSYKARWGCCDINRNIIFNYKLLMLPTRLWRCVIVHELCHTVYMDHSKQFKMLARSVMPDYDMVHKELKKYSCVTRLY